MESDTQTPSGHAKLCAKCEEFGIDERHFQPPFGEKSDDEDEERFSGTFDLGDYRDFSRRPQCPLCSMVATAVREFRVSEGPVDHLEAFMRQATKAQGGFRLHWTHLGATNLRQRMCLEIHSKEIVDDSYVRNLAFNDSPNVKIPGRVVLMRDGGERRQPLLGRAIGEQIDVDLLKGWLQKCVDWHSDASHEDHCQRLVLPQSIDPRQVDAFLVIDVVDECLTKPPSNCLFSALSYKWGGVNGLQAKVENITTLETVGSLGRLQDEIPNTIRDAMGLTRDLELRYLWVDQLCIVQDDLENKQAAIDSMAGVYAFAHLTIIAADGDDANAGLRGYGRRIRGYEQESFSLQPSLQLLLIPDLVSTLAASLYEDRAWTYQERVLSRRCLIFLNGQAYFRGSSSVPDPGPDAAVSQRWGPPPLNFGGRLLGSPASTPLDFCLSYAALVSAISRRRLSHQNDALNAAVGVLGPLAAAGGLRKDYGVLAGNPSEGFRTELLAGIPSVIFEEAIMWTPGPDVMHRREGFPSWSWAGWSGAIEKPAAMCVRRHKGSPTMTSTKHCFQWMHLARFYVPEFVDLKEEMRKTHRAHMTAFESPASVGRSCFSLLDFDNIPVEPLPTMKYQADPPREHVLLMWAVVFKAQWSAMVRRANTRVYAEHYDSDVVLEVRDGLGNFAGRILCHWPGYPEEPGPAWTEMDLVVARTCGKAHSQEDHLLTDWLIARLGLAGFEQKFWGAKGGWRSHICLENWEPAAPDKADDPFHRWTDRPDARFFYCVLVAWQADGIAERVGIGMILETAIRDAPAPGPRWKEILLA